MIEYSNIRLFKCSHENCYKIFKKSQSLKRHIDSYHLNLRPYMCKICSKRFRQSSSIKDHMFQHLSCKTFKCEVLGCMKIFQTPNNLNNHKRRQHKLFNIKSVKSVNHYTVKTQRSSDDLKFTEIKSSANICTQSINKGNINQNINIYQCNFNECNFNTQDFVEISEHFLSHWKQLM